ncbi:MAG TPA: RDD family protein [Pseudonocardia sp.]|jgi:uncharacterized RDD family membrane protein YckC|nr:RDD family protein [Pseudonocardia sp.]
MTNPQESHAPQQAYPGESYPAQHAEAGPPAYGAQPYPPEQYPGQSYGGQPYQGPRYGGEQYGGQPYGSGQPGYGYPEAGYRGLATRGPAIRGPAIRGPGAGVDDPTAVVGARVGQYLLDGVLVMVPLLALLFGLALLAAENDSALGALASLSVFLLAFGLSWGVHAWWPSTHGGQTPAMGWLNPRIVTARGGPPGIGALSVRWLLLMVDGSFGGLVGFIIMMSTSRHQRLGDIAASTYVVRAS